MSSALLLEETGQTRAPETSSHRAQATNPSHTRIAQVIILAILFAAPALRIVHTGTVGDPDIWWHLSAGNWILQHHAIPRVDPFSATVGGQPWQPYSWLFELLLSKLFRLLGLTGIVTYTAVLLIAITAAFQHLIRRLQADFSIGVLLTFVVGLSIGHLETPRPWLFTILFFILELDILQHARKTGRLRELIFLPFLFALWTNLHIQFIDGLLVLALAAVEAIASPWLPGYTRQTSRASRVALCATLAASVLATLANPFGPYIYRIAYDLAAQPGVLNKISELQANPFRDLADFLVLLLALASAAALARTRRIPLFEAGLLLFAAFISFRSRRDVWVVAAAAAAILAAGIPTPRFQKHPPLPAFATSIAFLLASLATLVGFRVMHINNARLTEFQGRDLPVKAVQFVQQHHLSGPLFNDYGWGGYFIYSLQIPVSIDGRAALYGDSRIDRSGATWSGEPDWNADSQLTHANLVIGPLKSPLTQLLRLDPHFQLAYEDKQAAVFTRRNQTSRNP